ncbi:DNA-protecting protein DprA [Rhodococcus sp. D2-41]|uniref:DNA-processing protein DprA n=1 Tax=Speluncibacter jeojiensis TaxID=2710754 RepID=UPI0024102510|nr:DNA-processing protein DprA [Rhodococcus sp. D2-41]MDG3010999.1 DNA-protecting protein DprA [Rhodococcus sp. D2-41]
MSDSEKLRAWAYLSRVTEGPCAALLSLVDQIGPVDAARAVRQHSDLPEALRSRTEGRRHIDRVDADLALLDRLGGRLLTREDPEWPHWRFVELGRARDTAAPTALWVLGDPDLAAVTERAAAIVGTRAASGYGEHVATELSGDLAAEDWAVISGAAYGIDGAAHRAALAAGGVTVAVLACGIDRVYPSGHAGLLRHIAESGSVVTEYPPGTIPAKFRFLARNRLVAALSDATVVVEAGWRSGARNTARWARALGRPVLAVPGPVTAATSRGCHRMIREGEAQLVTGAADVVEAAGPLDAAAGIGAVRAADRAHRRPTDGLDEGELAVYEALPVRGCRDEDQLSVESGLGVGAVRAALPGLEMRGLIEWSDQGWVRVRARRAR